MADGIILNLGSGGATLAADDVTSTHYQIVKAAFGALDTATLVTSSVGLPVELLASAAAIGKLAANTGVDIGDVDVTSIVPGTAATNLGKAEDAAHTSGDVGVMGLTVRQDTAAALGGTDADYQPLITDGSGRLHVNVGNTVTVGSHAVTNAGTFAVQATLAAGAATIAKAEDVASADADVGVPALAVRKATPANTSGTDGDYEFLQMSAGRLWVDPSGVTLTVASHAVTNAGTFAVQIDAGAVTSLATLDNTIVVDDAAFTPATTSVSMAGFQADEASTDSIDEGDAGAARMTLDRKIIVNPQPHKAGGATVQQFLDVDESEDEVSATACTLYGGFVTNTATAVRWLKFYNLTAANTTVGTSTPIFTWGIPGNATDDIAAVMNMGPTGIKFDTALSMAATTGFAVADTGAPGANDVIVSLIYQA